MTQSIEIFVMINNLTWKEQQQNNKTKNKKQNADYFKRGCYNVLLLSWYFYGVMFNTFLLFKLMYIKLLYWYSWRCLPTCFSLQN